MSFSSWVLSSAKVTDVMMLATSILTSRDLQYVRHLIVSLVGLIEQEVMRWMVVEMDPLPGARSRSTNPLA